MAFPKTYKFEMETIATTTGQDAVVSRFAPPCLGSNLFSKRMYASSLYINNTMLPLFIPEMMPENYAQSTFAGLHKGNCGFIASFGETYDINSIGYFIAVQKRDFTQTIVDFVKHVPQNPLNKPPLFPISDKNIYYLNKYYWYYNFAHFLKSVEASFNQALTSLIGPNSEPDPYVYITTDGKICTMYVRQDVSNQIFIYTSESLNDILPFNCSIFNFPNCWHINDTEMTTNFLGSTYDVFQCKYYDTIVPFTQVVVDCQDFPLTFQEFTSSAENLISYSKIFLSYFLEGNEIYNKFVYSATSPVPYVDFTENEVQNNKTFTIRAFARLKNDVLIPIQLRKNERFIVTFTVEESF